NAAGAAALGTSGEGVQVAGRGNRIGGTTTADRNIISGNSSYGVDVTGSGTMGNLVEGNYIGTNAAGDSALGNTIYGLLINGGASGNTIGGATSVPGTGAGNVISGNKGS